VSFQAFALFMGIAMSITAFPVLARILEERGLTRTPIGATALTCAAVDDVSSFSPVDRDSDDFNCRSFGVAPWSTCKAYERPPGKALGLVGLLRSSILEARTLLRLRKIGYGTDGRRLSVLSSRNRRTNRSKRGFQLPASNGVPTRDTRGWTGCGRLAEGSLEEWLDHTCASRAPARPTRTDP